MKTVLAIGGWDPTSGAGIIADVKAIHAAGAYAVTALTGLAVQTPQKVLSVKPVAPALLQQTLTEALAGMPKHALKTGMLGSPQNARIVFEFIRKSTLPWVFDPVRAATDGTRLGSGSVKSAFPRKGLSVITPNLPELGALAGVDVSSVKGRDAAIAKLIAVGFDAVLLKGGHATGRMVVDELVTASGERIEYSRRRLKGSLHGSGCTLASSLAAHLALGFPLRDAFLQAEFFMDAVWQEAALTTGGRRLSILPVGRSPGKRPLR
jgi:hydroxymethylpyrimidine/phosphomethylpyrimidine kinase